MPKVTKQTKKKTTKKKAVKKSGGVRDKLKPVNEERLGLRVTLYGQAKTGKTTLACDFPKPLLLVGTVNSLEDGRLSVANVEGIDFFPLSEASELDEVCQVAVEDNYKTVVLDTGGGMQDLILKEHLGLAEIPLQRNWGMAQQKDWQVIGAQTKERLRELLSLARDHGIHSIVIAHERSFDTDSENDMLTPRVGAALTPAVTGWLNGASDLVCQTFIREGTTEKKQKVANKEVKTKVKTGTMEYCLRVGPHPVYIAGYYGPKAKSNSQDVIVDPSYEKIRKVVQG